MRAATAAQPCASPSPSPVRGLWIPRRASLVDLVRLYRAHYGRGLPQQEVAKRCGCSVRTVRAAWSGEAPGPFRRGTWLPIPWDLVAAPLPLRARQVAGLLRMRASPPSTRQLAEELGLARRSVRRLLALLVTRGWVYVRQLSGRRVEWVVAQTAAVPDPEPATGKSAPSSTGRNAPILAAGVRPPVSTPEYLVHTHTGGRGGPGVAAADAGPGVCVLGDELQQLGLFSVAAIRGAVAHKLDAAGCAPGDLVELLAWAERQAPQRPRPYLAAALRLAEGRAVADLVRLAREQRAQRDAVAVRARWEAEQRAEEAAREARAAADPVDPARIRADLEALQRRTAARHQAAAQVQRDEAERRAAVLARMRAQLGAGKGARP